MTDKYLAQNGRVVKLLDNGDSQIMSYKMEDGPVEGGHEAWMDEPLKPYKNKEPTSLADMATEQIKEVLEREAAIPVEERVHTSGYVQSDSPPCSKCGTVMVSTKDGVGTPLWACPNCGRIAVRTPTLSRFTEVASNHSSRTDHVHTHPSEVRIRELLALTNVQAEELEAARMKVARAKDISEMYGQFMMIARDLGWSDETGCPAWVYLDTIRIDQRKQLDELHTRNRVLTEIRDESSNLLQTIRIGEMAKTQRLEKQLEEMTKTHMRLEEAVRDARDQRDAAEIRSQFDPKEICARLKDEKHAFDPHLLEKKVSMEFVAGFQQGLAHARDIVNPPHTSPKWIKVEKEEKPHGG